ncbi:MULTISPECIES: hypothetical protein [Bacillus]|uniref:hypothetical protein n=1 Tax=Bacillus TaxID=1386 RepID=UPI0009B72C67|nr:MULTISPECIES: hypothetical protein [Bacillus]ARW41672.1 hypothetical protein S100141_00349 [Bacillus licheniformis]AXF87792.1 hypothetical protein BLDA23_05700 [Bacillus licheniformis]KAA6475755.1 hypothetical protein DX928_06520 [Bacillus swezeyi]MCA1182436.1 hypothetical protein [Bacillus licheniformis]MEC0474945.1 hypothetical protein [Bacillus licheniformis]
MENGLATTISEILNALSPFIIGYLIFSVVLFVFVFSFIIFVAIKVIKGHREFEKRRKENGSG